ncbi:hypothetical protein T02_585, partial [Trichinella nativa]
MTLPCLVLFAHEPLCSSRKAMDTTAVAVASCKHWFSITGLGSGIKHG